MPALVRQLCRGRRRSAIRRSPSTPFVNANSLLTQARLPASHLLFPQRQADPAAVCRPSAVSVPPQPTSRRQHTIAGKFPRSFFNQRRLGSCRSNRPSPTASRPAQNESNPECTTDSECPTVRMSCDQLYLPASGLASFWFMVCGNATTDQNLNNKVRGKIDAITRISTRSHDCTLSTSPIGRKCSPAGEKKRSSRATVYESPATSICRISGEDRIRTCGPGYPGHRFSKPALSTTQPPLRNVQRLHCSGRFQAASIACTPYAPRSARAHPQRLTAANSGYQ